MFDFVKNISVKGKWWIPSEDKSEKDGIYGVLKYDKHDGLSLRVEGSLFGTESLFKSLQNFHTPILYGVTQEGIHITLFNLYGNELGSNDWIYTDIDIEYALSCKSPYFAVCDMDVHHLNFNLNCFSPFLEDISGKLWPFEHTDDIVKFSYAQPPAIDILDNERLKAYFYFSYSFKGLGSNEDFTFSSNAYLNFENKIPVVVKDAVANLKFYKDFFTFFSFRKVSFNKAYLYAKNEEGNSVEFSFICKDQSTEVGDRTKSYEILLDYKETQDVFPEMLATWIDNQHKINSGLALFMQVKYLKFPTPIQSFLNLVFALETLHNTYYHSRALSFAEKLKDLINRNEHFLSEFIYDVDDFCKRVKVHRNYLAHDHSKVPEAIVPEKYYSYFIYTMRMIYECNFFRILTLDDRRIELYLKRHFTYQTNKSKNYQLIQELL